ncbi:MAG: hypothetical protein B1H07_03360 [Campylobacteraceae bacterium 4484_166]|nr:MAG: hypothetical protein B1H07_03360 [Campylobacteraceae bacterium 4484_166]
MRNFINIVIVAILSLVIVSCSSKEKPKPVSFQCKQGGVLAPKWTCNPAVEGAIADVGIAKMNAGNDKSFQRSEALADGRDRLAAQVAVKVSNLFKQYKGTTGAGKASTFDKATSFVSKQLVSETLNGSKSVDIWEQPTTKELFLLVTVSTDSVAKAMDKAIKTSFKNDQAMYQKFLASQANGELNKELEKIGE